MRGIGSDNERSTFRALLVDGHVETPLQRRENTFCLPHYVRFTGSISLSIIVLNFVLFQFFYRELHSPRSTLLDRRARQSASPTPRLSWQPRRNPSSQATRFTASSHKAITCPLIDPSNPPSSLVPPQISAILHEDSPVLPVIPPSPSRSVTGSGRHQIRQRVRGHRVAGII